jgi:hypothetical protein
MGDWTPYPIGPGRRTIHWSAWNGDSRKFALRLSEKGYEQRSEREIGRAGRQKWVEKCRFGAL